MNQEAFQTLVIQNLGEIKKNQTDFNERLNETCTTLTTVKTTQLNYLENHKMGIDKRFKTLGLILGLPTVIFQTLQYIGVL